MSNNFKIMKIKTLYENISYNFIFSKKLRKIYLNILFVIITVIVAFYLGYNTRNNRIDTLYSEINVYNQSEDSLIVHIRDLNKHLIEYTKMKRNAEYHRYIAFRESRIFIPDRVDKKDIVLMHKMAIRYDIPFKYYYKLINQESRFKPNAKSVVGAYGYMQIMPATYRGLVKRYNKNKKDTDLDLNILSSKQRNIVLGSFYLNDLYKRYNDWSLTFAAYNAGSANVAKYKGIPPFKETQHYVKYIMK